MTNHAPRPLRAAILACLLSAAVCVATASRATAQTYAPILRGIDTAGDVGGQPSVTLYNGRLAISYADDSNQDLKLWIDDGRGGGTAGDMIANGTEIRVIDAAHTITSSGSYVGRLRNCGGQLAIAYYDATGQDLLLWYDDGRGGGTAGDGAANGTEIRTIASTDDVGLLMDIAWHNNHLAVTYRDFTNTLLMLWYDNGRGGGTADDGLANGTEIQTIAAIDAQELAMTVVNGRLAIAFQDAGPQNLMIWYDDGAGMGTADNVTADGGEVRTASSDHPTGFFNSIFDFNGHVAVGYYHFPNDTLRLWYDDGTGGGTPDNGVADGSEIRTIDSSTFGTGYYPSITTIQNRLAMCTYGASPDALRIWYDDGLGGGTAGDVESSGTEVRILSGTDSGYYSKIVGVGSNYLVVAYYESTNDDLYLAIQEVAAAPNAPSSLGPTAKVDGSSSLIAAPTLTLTQSDINASDTLIYQVQIDDTSNFSSPVVDYTSAAVAQGSASFTVGQAAGGGSYTVGSAAQTLAIGSYYWRVRTSDPSTTSGWTVANSGAVAFVVLAVPTVSTDAASSITSSTATSGGNVTVAGSSSVMARGVCWSTTTSPTTADSHTSDGSGTGTFTSSLTGHAPGTLYYVRAYATNADGTGYGNEVSFTTAAVLPTVTTTAVSSITPITAASGGNVTATGGAAVTARGVCWSTANNPTTSDSHTTDGTGSGAFTSSLTGLSPGTTYYVRAYATNSVGTAYGSEVSFTASATTPTVMTTVVSSIATTTATSGGEVTATGGAGVTARGVCWSTANNPTTSDSHTTDGTGSGTFTSSLTSLSPATTYHVRAYATNSAGTAYGSEASFTAADPPAAALSMGVTARDESVMLGDPALFEITVENTGDGDATGLTLSFTVPSQATLDVVLLVGTTGSVAAPTTTTASGTTTLSFTNLPAGAFATLHITFNTIATGTLQLAVSAATSDPDVTASGTAEVTVDPVATVTPPVTPPLCGLGFLSATFGGLLGLSLLSLTRRRTPRRRGG